MSFTLIHAGGNMFASTAKRHAIVTSADDGDAFTISEAQKDHGFIRARPGFDEHLYNELAIGWRASKFDLVERGGKPVMPGGKHGTGRRGDRRRRGPTREVAWVVLREKATGKRTILATHHAIAKADTAHKWRRPLRDQGFRNTALALNAVRAEYPDAPLVLTGDLNTIGRVQFGIAGIREARTPATFGRLRYDRILTTPGASVTGIKTKRTAGDHKALLAQVTLGPVTDPQPEPPEPPEVPEVATSQNGYIANDRSRIETITIPGTTRKVALRKGAPGQLLAHFAGWFDKAIESVDGGQLDDWGYAERPIRGSKTTLSNHASGTALDINAPRHPLGKRNTFTPGQMRRIREQLKEYEGAIRWGGDYKNRADEMHFEIMASPERCAAVLKKVTTPPEPPAPKETPYDELYGVVEKALAALGPQVQANYKARRRFVDALTAALEAAPVPTTRKKAKA